MRWRISVRAVTKNGVERYLKWENIKADNPVQVVADFLTSENLRSEEVEEIQIGRHRDNT